MVPFSPAVQAKLARRRFAAPKQGCPYRPRGAKQAWPRTSAKNRAPRNTKTSLALDKMFAIAATSDTSDATNGMAGASGWGGQSNLNLI